MGVGGKVRFGKVEQHGKWMNPRQFGKGWNPNEFSQRNLIKNIEWIWTNI